MSAALWGARRRQQPGIANIDRDCRFGRLWSRFYFAQLRSSRAEPPARDACRGSCRVFPSLAAARCVPAAHVVRQKEKSCPACALCAASVACLRAGWLPLAPLAVAPTGLCMAAWQCVRPSGRLPARRDDVGSVKRRAWPGPRQESCTSSGNRVSQWFRGGRYDPSEGIALSFQGPWRRRELGCRRASLLGLAQPAVYARCSFREDDVSPVGPLRGRQPCP